MLVTFESLKFYGYYTASDVDVLGDAIIFMGTVFSILLITMWRKVMQPAKTAK